MKETLEERAGSEATEEVPKAGGETSVHRSARWSSIGRGGVQGIRFLSSLMIFRLLGPESTGLMQMALVVTGFLDQFRDVGTAMAVVQRKEVDRPFVSSVFVINLMIGGLLSILLITAAGPVALLFGEPRLAPVLRVVGPVFLISCVGLVHRALLMREMSFDRIARVDIMSAVTYGGVAITFASLGHGVWSLVWGYLASAIVTTSALWIYSRWVPRLALRRVHWQEIRGFCSNLVGFSLVNYFIGNFDRILIGRMLGVQALGLYGFAFYLTMFPVRSITSILISVLIPSLSRLQDQDRLLREKYVRACAGIALVTFPMMFGIASVADPLVRSFWGSRWLDAIPLVVLLTPVAIVDSIGKTTGSVFIAKGRADLMFRCAVAFGVVTVVSLFIGAQWGVRGVASAYALSALLLAFFRISIPFGLVSLDVAGFARTLAPYLAAGGFMAAVVVALRSWALPGVEDPRLVLAASVAVGAMFYVTWMWWARPRSLLDLKGVLVGRASR